MKVGDTPLVKLSDKLYGKLESLNPGGSIKDRPVKYILDRYEKDGLLKKGDTITWEYKGTVKSGTIKKLNHKTCEVLGAGGSPFGNTTYKIYKSMITGVV